MNPPSHEDKPSFVWKMFANFPTTLSKNISKLQHPNRKQEWRMSWQIKRSSQSSSTGSNLAQPPLPSSYLHYEGHINKTWDYKSTPNRPTSTVKSFLAVCLTQKYPKEIFITGNPDNFHTFSLTALLNEPSLQQWVISLSGTVRKLICLCLCGTCFGNIKWITETPKTQASANSKSGAW